MNTQLFDCYISSLPNKSIKDPHKQINPKANVSEQSKNCNVICYDPDAEIIYTQNLYTNKFKLFCKPTANIKVKIQAQLDGLNDLLFGKGNDKIKIFSKEATRSRSKPLKKHLIFKDRGLYPFAIDSHNYLETFRPIELHVNVKEFLENKSMNVREEVIKVSVFPSMGAEEVLKTIVRLMFMQRQKPYEPKKNGNVLVLKNYSTKEFIFGDLPIKNYACVAKGLRFNSRIKLTLTEIETKARYFPPISNKKLNINNFKWDKFTNNSIYFKRCNQDLNRSTKTKLKLLKKIFNPKYDNAHDRIIPVLSKVSYSGENDFIYRLRIIGIDNILQLFSTFHNEKKELTENSLELRLQEVKIYEQEKNKNYRFFRIGKSSSSKILESFSGNDDGKTIKASVEKDHFNHEAYFSKIQNIARRFFPLSFVPYIIRIEVGLYSGCTLLSPILETHPIPFTTNPRFYQWIRFPSDIRISSLPLEARLIFNVKIYGEDGTGLVIGSTVLKVFNDRFKFRTGLQELNLWPFHRVKKEYICMGEYYGLVEKNEGDSKVNAYARLYVQHDEFGLDMHYSLRDTNQMTTLGYPSIEPNEKTENVLLNRNEINTLDLLLTKKINLNKKKNLFANEEKKLLTKLSQHYKKPDKKGEKKHDEEDETKTEDEVDKKRLEADLVHYLEYLKSEHSLSLNILEYSLFCGMIGKDDNELAIKKESIARLNRLLKRNFFLFDYTSEEKKILFDCRDVYQDGVLNLMIFFMSVTHTSPIQVNELHIKIRKWKPLKPEEAIIFLSQIFGDPALRLYAVERISLMADDVLSAYLYFLVEAIKYENFHQSPLVDLLMSRALISTQIGHRFFWIIKHHLHNPLVYERYLIILEEYLTHCGSFLYELYVENYVTECLHDVVYEKSQSDNLKDPNEKKDKMLKKLIQLTSVDSFPSKFSSPLNHHRQGRKLINDISISPELKAIAVQIEPEYQNHKLIEIYLKQSVDIKRDVFLSEMLKIIDHMWLSNGLDFKITCIKMTQIDANLGMFEFPSKSMLLTDFLKKFEKDENGLLKCINEHVKPTRQETIKKNLLDSLAALCTFCMAFGLSELKIHSFCFSKSSGSLGLLEYGQVPNSITQKKNKNKLFIDNPKFNNFIKSMSMNSDYETFKQKCLKAMSVIYQNAYIILSLIQMILPEGIKDFSDSEALQFVYNQIVPGNSENLKMIDQSVFDKDFRRIFSQNKQ